MNTTHLEKARKIYGFAMDLSLDGNKLRVANDGYITDNPADITAKKHSGNMNGYYYQFTKKGYQCEIIAVIRAISEQEALA